MHFWRSRGSILHKLSRTLLQGRNMVYPGPIDPYFHAVILIPEPHFPQNFDPWALIKELIPSMFLHKILT